MNVDKEIEELKRRLADVEAKLKQHPRKGGYYVLWIIVGIWGLMFLIGLVQFLSAGNG
ncbi:hypothetical protein L3476_04570 [Paenibacillus thiaminolyticus]|uniref:hypothetical protein n=1 Tax=Paenibacillus thiaminolyticus TaxID=49283 RepID=UPI0013F5D1F1|nr:hypothetical protein [Paenibacillus thiaminolyticus]NGP59783.1 hypothetical protein [Paenibacillus thiaminolyticus]WCR28051.1 hypothetical protein L3476_04570 [Paenibacillus thiaminolyticus]